MSVYWVEIVGRHPVDMIDVFVINNPTHERELLITAESEEEAINRINAAVAWLNFQESERGSKWRYTYAPSSLRYLGDLSSGYFTRGRKHN